jgi:LytS/YehU family sensor histidine kinase
MPIDEDFEFNPFEWAQTSARAHASALQQLVTLKARVRSEQETAAKLHAQLEEFIRTKNDTETAMLEQFMELLNLKKHKIRDQSRLLAAAKVDESTGQPCHLPAS